ncbi:MAG: hypothetical protein SXQ77_11830 [Halobacteria archaeon]|nr:hypothetical protein [Halobacteria archaeon]
MTDTDIVATTTGYFPRPDYVIETLKDVEGHQKEGMGDAEKKVEDVIKKGRKEVIEIQENAGMNLVTEGQLSWDDIIAFPTTRMTGVEMGGIIRFYDNNRFYREPRVVDELGRDEPLTVDQYESAEKRARSPVKPVMAGPYSHVSRRTSTTTTRASTTTPSPKS